MFFRKLQNTGTSVSFDGKSYVISAASDLDHFNCRMDLFSKIWPKFESDSIDD